MLGIADNCIAGSIRVIRFTSKTLYIHDIHHSRDLGWTNAPKPRAPVLDWLCPAQNRGSKYAVFGNRWQQMATGGG